MRVKSLSRWEEVRLLVKMKGLAHSVRCPTLDFGAGRDLMVVRSSPALGSALGTEVA